ncbi:hypothetical protein A1O1_00226 [Capronia coronata CBS 617.96]|uniref:Uncharacterized protein n=1 Tax=Capronia coronata CBS 617.96 TaxID=1182541 RepID=W9YQA0_9EURO|nr:uncharacterized protein A1O1_00226 [Capronia coronata CBS 617.96]EXJ95107.1 hypothetical protein A1O1_00226 [Capronia coronata CBS 617.96]
MDPLTVDGEKAHSEELDPVLPNVAPCDSPPHKSPPRNSPPWDSPPDDSPPRHSPLTRQFLEDYDNEDEDDEILEWNSISSMSISSDSESENDNAEDSTSGRPGVRLRESDHLSPSPHNTPNDNGSPRSSSQPACYLGCSSPTDKKYDGLKHREESPAPNDNDLPTVVKEKHFEGENDMMSGAVSPDDEIKVLSTFTDDTIMCVAKNDLSAALSHMPLKVIGRYELATLHLPFNDMRSLRFLPFNYLSTYLGVKRAIEEVTQHPGYTDQDLLHALLKRGGSSRRRVVYPEYINSFFGFGRADEDDEEKAYKYDLAYWQQLYELGEFWEYIDVP